MNEYKYRAIKIIEEKNKAAQNLNSVTNKFFTHLTTILLIFLGLVIQLQPDRNHQDIAWLTYLAGVVLLVLCMIFCLIVLYGEIFLAREIHRIHWRKLQDYIENQGQLDLKISNAHKSSIFLWSEKLALVMLAFSLVCIIAYIAVR